MSRVKLNTKKIQALRAEHRRKGLMPPAFCHPDDERLVLVRVHTSDGIKNAMWLCGRLVYDPKQQEDV